MTVELAACLPVILIVAFVVVHGLTYAGACARSDEMAAQFVRIEAASPARGSADEGTVCAAIASDMEEAFGSYPGVSFTVDSSWIDGIDGSLVEEAGCVFSVAPHHTRYTVTTSYRPEGLPSSVFGVQIGGVSHDRSFVVDPYKPGVWM